LAVALVPVSLAFVFLAVGWLLTLPPVDSFPADEISQPRWLLALAPNATPVTAAFLGAYFFSLQMLFRRYVRSDLRGSAYVAVVIRIVLAVLGIWIIQAVAKSSGWWGDADLLVLGFAIGVFPVVVWQIIRSLATRIFKVTLPNLRSRMPLDQIDGLTVWHEARLEEEDIENVQNMATADVVDLLVNTRLPAGRIVDWIDQAILITHIGSGAAYTQLSEHGIRTASALLVTLQRQQSPGRRRRYDLQRALLEGGVTVCLEALVAALSTSSNLRLVLRWQGLDLGKELQANPVTAEPVTAALPATVEAALA
jgi:hypothetical protein